MKDLFITNEQKHFDHVEFWEIYWRRLWAGDWCKSKILLSSNQQAFDWCTTEHVISGSQFVQVCGTDVIYRNLCAFYRHKLLGK